jgi:YegS/Rv2252/BmrU family lipid kinase
MSWFVLVNPAAGRGKDVIGRTRAALVEHEVAAEIVISESAGHLRSLVDDAVADGRRRFVAVGGDGTVNLVVDALLRHAWEEPPTLGVLPAGTGCDLMRVFGLPQSIEGAVSHLLGDEVYVADAAVLTGEWGDRHFINIAQAGIGAAAAKMSDRMSGLGKLRYTAAFWMTLPRFRSAVCQLSAGGRSFEGEAIAVILANGQFFASGMNVAPKASLMSGEFDLQVFAVRKRHAFTLFPRVRYGLHLNHPRVKRFRAGAFRLETDDPWPLEVDGEYLGSTPVEGRILPGAVALKI